MRRTVRRVVGGAALAGCLAIAASGARGAYTVQRVAGGLNQPMYVTQAPGDNTVLYVVERSDPGNQLGRIRAFDLQTQMFAETPFLDLTGQIVADGGLLAMTFHPEYQSNGLFYVTSNNAGTNALDEYRRVGGVSQFQRRLLQYQNLNNIFHTINQPLFRPGGNSNELFVTTGDGGTQADEAAFNPALIESPNSLYGKVLRINLGASFPAPATDATHAGVDVVALGIRNPFRSSFDRQTGDFYFGDVGFNLAEEVNFIPASHFANPAAPILDFGWVAREGTAAAASPHGGPKAPGDIDPIFDYAHSGQPLPHPSVINGLSVTGGYVYRGPVTEFQGRYFFSDYLNHNVYSGTFDRSTPAASFNGTNLGGITNHTAAFETAIGGGADIRNVTSFGEDNAGNLYIVKFGNGFFPPLGQGEIFRVSPVISAAVNVQIQRETGSIVLSNTSTEALSFTAYTIASAYGAIAPEALTPITGNYDFPAGDGSVDPNNPWQITSPAGSRTLFREATTGDAGALAAGAQVVLATDGGWIPSHVEDVFVSLLLNDGSVLNATVAFAGNGGQPFDRGDLDVDGDVDIDDWVRLLGGAYSDLSGLSPAESYGHGDLDGDGDSDFADFRLFKSDFDAANGVGSFEAMTRGVPEPAAAPLALAVALLSGAGSRGMRAGRRRAFAFRTVGIHHSTPREGDR